jgi:hypothetical protein
MMTKIPAEAKPHGIRWGLYGPVIALGIIATGWSTFWFVAKSRAETAITTALAREASAGRRWTCDNRSISGFPFRFDLSCGALKLEQDTPEGIRSLNLGQIAATARIYAPQHVIAESPGPLIIKTPSGTQTEMIWSNAQISIRLNLSGLERASLVADTPKLTISGVAGAATQAKSLELHLRRHPTRPEADRAQEISLSLKAASNPTMDNLFGSPDPSDLDMQMTVPQAPIFLGGIRPQTLETWRLTGTMLDVNRLTLKKGKAELSLTGKVGLDDLHRIKGRFEAAQGGIDQIAGMRIGPLLNTGALLAGRPSGAANASGLKPLPPVDLRDGRLYIGPIRLPEPRLEPLY